MPAKSYIALSIVFASAAFCPLPAVVYTWVGGENGSWRSLSSYTVDGETPSVLPGADDRVFVNQAYPDVSVNVSAEDNDFIAGLDQIMLRYATLTLNITTDCVFRVAINGSINAAKTDHSRTGNLVKNGAGTLTLEAYNRYKPTATRTGDYLLRDIKVNEGDLRFRVEGHPTLEAGNVYLPILEVAKNSTIYLYDGEPVTGSVMDGFVGSGTMVCTPVTNGVPVLHQASIPDNADEPCVFSGKMSGKFRMVINGGTHVFTGEESDFSEQIYVGQNGTLGFTATAERYNSPQPLGVNAYLYFNSDTKTARAVYMGGAGGTLGKTIRLHGYRSGVMLDRSGTLDGGATGGLLLNYRGAVMRVSGSTYSAGVTRFAFAGSNDLECVWSNKFTETAVGGVMQPTTILKEGTGVWRFADYADRNNLGGVAVDEGTLRFDSVAAPGTCCSLGLATIPYDPDYVGPVDQSKIVGYHIRVGATGETQTATLEYSGEFPGGNASRVLAVRGKGRLSCQRAKRYAQYGVVTAGAGNHELTLAGEDVESRNVLGDVTNTVGTLSIVKEGAGTWLLQGAQTFNGTLSVDGGTLIVANPKHFRYFRFTVRSNMFGSDAQGVSTGTAFRNKIGFSEFALYDADGVRRNSHLAQVGSFAELRPGTFCVDAGTCEPKISNYQAHPSLMFADTANHTKCAYFSGPTTAFDEGNSSTHLVFTMMLDDDAGEIKAWDYACFAMYSSAWYVANPRSFLLEGSIDGSTWVELDSETDALHNRSYATGNGRWTSTDTAPSRNQVRNLETECYRFKNSAAGSVSLNAPPLANVSEISVAAGATLRYVGEVAPIRALKVSAAGAGTIDGATFAGEGALAVDGLDESQPSAEIGLTLANVTGAANIESWSITVNGDATAHYFVRLGGGKIVVAKRGMRVIVR